VIGGVRLRKAPMTFRTIPYALMTVSQSSVRMIQLITSPSR